MTMRLIIRHPTKQLVMLHYAEPVEYGGARNGEGHHDDEVGEKGEGAEDQVGHLPKPSLDHLCTQYLLIKLIKGQAFFQHIIPTFALLFFIKNCVLPGTLFNLFFLLLQCSNLQDPSS
jgi:hypothetical protein